MRPVKTNALRVHCNIEIMEKRDKLFKKCCLHVDKDNYKEARNEVQKLIRTKKKAYFENKLTENIWKSIINCLENDKSANFDVKDIVKDFSTYFLNLAKNLVSKLSNPSYGVLSVAQYYNHLGLNKKFDLLPTEKDYVLKILRDINISNVRFIKEVADVLAKPVTNI